MNKSIIFNALIAATFLMPSFSEAYNIQTYNVGYLPDTINQAIDYQDSRRCAIDLEAFDEKYTSLADELHASIQPNYTNRYRSEGIIRNELKALQKQYSQEFGDCVRYAINIGDEPRSAEKAKKETQNERERSSQIDDLREQLREANRNNAALQAQVEQLIAMVQEMLAMGFTTPQ